MRTNTKTRELESILYYTIACVLKEMLTKEPVGWNKVSKKTSICIIYDSFYTNLYKKKLNLIGRLKVSRMLNFKCDYFLKN